MGQAQSSSGASAKSGALASFYAKNGADVRPLTQAKSKAIIDQLCTLFAADAKSVFVPSSVSAGPGQSAAGVTGGAESFIGGFDDMQGYANSMYSKAKEKLIRSIAKDVFAALKVSGVKNADTAPIEDVVKNLTKLLPPSMKNPKKFHENFNKSVGNQKHVIKALADAINKHYSGALIDVDGDENATTAKVAEIIYSLLQGLHTEFMNIAGDAMRVMNNMRVVQNYLDAAYNKQKEMIATSSDPRIRDQAASSDELYKAIRAEYDRQSAVLANLLDVSIGPTGKSLISSLEDSKDFTGLVKDLRAMVGTQAFGDKLSYLLSGVSTVAHTAELIDKALKKIGMSVNEFKSASNAGDIRGRVFKHIMDQSPSSKKLDEMMAAAKIIYEANYDHDNVSKLLGKKGGVEHLDGMGNPDENPANINGGRYDVDGGADSDDDNLDAYGSGEHDQSNDDHMADGKHIGKTGGAADEDLPNYWQRKSLQRKIDNKKQYRDVVLKDFRKQLRRQLKSVVDASNQIASHIGTTVPVDDQLRQFVESFAAVKNLDQENIHIALSGYPRDSTSKEKRELFLYSYDSAMKAAEPLTKGPQGQLFKAVHSALGAMIKLIDDFQDKMVKALTEVNIDRPEDISAALKRTASTFYGSGDSGEDSFGSGDWVAFDKVKNEMMYYLSIANIKTNLARSVEDIKSYGDDYEQILGEEAGWIIDRIREQYMARINNVKDVAGAVPLPDRPVAASELELINGAIATGASQEEKTTSINNFKTFWTFQMNAKVNMVKVAQAIDLYMKAFTDGMSRNPDSISSIVKMLDVVDIVARWFNDRSGDQLASLFDFFPNSFTDSAPHYLADGVGAANLKPDDIISKEGVIKIPNGTNHYYIYLESRWTADATVGPAAGPYTVHPDHNHLPGNPFLGRSLLGNVMSDKQCKGVLQLSQKVIKSMRALENILSAFVSVGSKFGDVDPLSKSFMTPGQIFNALCEYVAASAFANGFLADASAGNNAGRLSAIYEGDTKEASVQHTPPAGGLAQVQDIPTNRQGAAGHISRPSGQTHNWSQHYADQRSINIANGGQAGAPGPRAAAAQGQLGILVGVDGRANIQAPTDYHQKYTKFAMAAIPSSTELINKWEYHNIAKTGSDAANDVRYDVAGWRDMFFDTDLLFEMTIKAIVAKIFTVVDAYRLFHRPTIDRRAHYSLNPLRTILGGSADGGAVSNKVKVIPEALELYFRLVLLAEWYRENFGVEAPETGAARAVATSNDAWRVTLVPSIDGIWSDFVDVVFDKAGYVKDGGYSETHIQKMILAVNDIWKAYRVKYPKSTTRNILNAFVLEMNRAFGFLRNKDIENYLGERRKNMNVDQSDDSKENFMDYDLLNADEQFGSRPAPSDRFSKVSTNTTAPRKATNMVFLQKAIEDLRKKIDIDFLRVTQEEGTGRNITYGDSSNHFQNSLRQYRNDMANAKDEVAEYNVVLRMLQSANRYMTQSADKLIMVHEAIATPLAMLYAVYKVMARFNAFCHGTSLANIAKWNDKRSAAPGANPAMSTSLDHPTAARNAYSEFLADDTTTEYKNIDISKDKRKQSIMVRLFTRALFGSNGDPASQVPFGYLLDNPGANVGIRGQDIDAAHLAKDIIAAILDFGTNNGKLVNVNIGGNGDINIEYSALEELCKDLLAQVKDNCKKLRNDFLPNDAEIVDKYETEKTIGSTRWLEEHLVQQLLNNRDKSGLPVAVMHLRDTFKQLCEKNTSVAGANVAAALGSAIGAPTVAYSTLDNAVSGLIFYEAENGQLSLPNDYFVTSLTKFPGNLVGLKKTADTNEEKKAISQAGSADNFESVAVAQAFNGISPMPVVFFDNADTVTSYNMANNNYKSLMQAFNKLLTMYLYTSVEDGTSKFYAPLIESFATSAASLEVMQGKAFPNIGLSSEVANVALAGGGVQVAVGQANNPAQMPLGLNPVSSLHAPPKGTVIYASNAVIIRSLLTSVMSIGTAQKKKFLFDNLAEMPEHLKDRLRVNLPIFAKLFENIANRAAMLKQLLNLSSLKANVAAVAAGQANVRVIIPGSEQLLNRNVFDTAMNTEYFNGLLTRLIDCGQSIRKCVESVYRELQDKPPAFFEMSKDFLQDYRSRNGGLPLMPFSSVLTPMRSLEGDTTGWKSTEVSHLMMPVKENGSNPFKYNFATRLLLNKHDLEVSLDHFPGAKEIFNAYASVANKTVMISPVEYSNTIKHTFRLGKYLMDGAVYGRLFDQPNRDLTGNLYASRNVFTAVQFSADMVTEISDLISRRWRDTKFPNAVTNAAATGEAAWDAKTCQVNNILPLSDPNDISGVIELTENTNLSASKERLAKFTSNAGTGYINKNDRKTLRVFNILDAGIVPLNVHAFMREVPFVNILNYAYTFDRMIHDFVLPSYLSNGLRNIAPAPGPGQAAPAAQYAAPPGAVLSMDNIIMGPGANVNSTRELLVKLLVHPYADLGADGKQYFALLASLFNGNDNMKLGRPRYLSDQLWHKVLMTSSAQLVAGQSLIGNPADRYDSKMASLEAGPTAYEAVRAVARYAGPSLSTTRSMANLNPANANHLTIASDPVSTSGLKYFDSKTNTWRVHEQGPANPQNNMATGDVIYCAELGKMRFDTKLVRNLVWFVQLQRIMRVVLTNHLSWINTPVVRGLKIADAKVTEFEGNDQFTEADYDGSRYDVI